MSPVFHSTLVYLLGELKNVREISLSPVSAVFETNGNLQELLKTFDSLSDSLHQPCRSNPLDYVGCQGSRQAESSLLMEDEPEISARPFLLEFLFHCTEFLGL